MRFRKLRAAQRSLFFNLQDDTGEFRNLTDDPAHQPRGLNYAQRMLSWRMSHDERVLANTRLSAEGPVERKTPRRAIARDPGREPAA